MVGFVCSIRMCAAYLVGGVVTPLAPPTEAEVKKWRDEAQHWWTGTLVKPLGNHNPDCPGCRLVALCDAYLAQRGEDWVPTTNIDRTFEEMEKRGLGPWVESIKAYMGSTGAFYTMQAYRDALARATVAEERLAALSAAPLAPEHKTKEDK